MLVMALMGGHVAKGLDKCFTRVWVRGTTENKKFIYCGEKYCIKGVSVEGGQKKELSAMKTNGNIILRLVIALQWNQLEN